MSEGKKGGLFVNRKPGGANPAAAAATVSEAKKPKDVKKRWIYVGMGLVGAVVVSTSLFGDNKPKPTIKKKADEQATAMVSVTPPKATDMELQATLGTKLEELRQETEKLKSDLSKKDNEIESLRKNANKEATTPTPPEGVAPPPTMSNTGGLSAPTAAPIAPPAPVVRPPALPTQGTTGMTPPPALPSSGMSIPGSTAGSSSNNGGDPMVFEPPARAGEAAAGKEASGKSSEANTVKARLKYERNPNAGMLPAGAFATVALLNGLDAGTSAATQANPMPVLMNVLDQATLPGAARFKMKSCFVLGTGYGDMSAERVYVRFSRMSCVDKANRLILSQEVQGYLVDSDGKLGMRGAITDRQGAKLGKALLAGFAQGLTGALGSAQSSVLSNLSTGTTTSTISGSAALRASGLAGAQAATAQLADFYLKEAQNMFPVITVDAGRKGTIIFTSSTALNWTNGENQFVQEITPEN